jgi:hypothetical protein
MEVGIIIHAIGALVFVLGFAYLIYATAAKSEGVLQSVGNLLAIAVAAVGVLFVVAMATAPMFGGRPFGLEMHGHGPAATSAAAPATAPAGGATPAPETGGDAGGKPGGKR